VFYALYSHTSVFQLQQTLQVGNFLLIGWKSFLSLSYHYISLSRGVIDSRDIFSFGMICCFRWNNNQVMKQMHEKIIFHIASLDIPLEEF
jgi:hypothetical protein